LSAEKFLGILFYAIDAVKKICYICREVRIMAKPNIAGKLKNLARELKEENNQGGIKKGDAAKTSESRKKQSTDGSKESGRKA